MSEEFIKVNGASVDTRAALQWRMLAGDTSFLDETVTAAVVIQYAREHGISTDKMQVQNVLEEFRYANGMESAESFQLWLDQHNIDMPTLAHFCEMVSLRNNIRERISDEDCRSALAEDPQRYQSVELYRLTVDDEEMADELRAQIEDGTDTFQNLTREHSLDFGTRRQGGFMGDLTRDELRGDIEAAAFASSGNELIGPVKDDDGYSLYLVTAVHQPDFDSIKEGIRDDLFTELLADLRVSAKVNYCALGFESVQDAGNAS